MRFFEDPEDRIIYKIDVEKVLKKYPLIKRVLRLKMDGVNIDKEYPTLQKRLQRLRKKMPPGDIETILSSPGVFELEDFT